LLDGVIRDARRVGWVLGASWRSWAALGLVGGFETRPKRRTHPGIRIHPVDVEQNDDPVYVVWHHHERVQRDMRIMVRQTQPAFAHDALPFSTITPPETQPNKRARRTAQTVMKHAPGCE
jgi:hypothetical protein